MYEEGELVTEIADGHRHRIWWDDEHATAYCSLPDQMEKPDLPVPTHEAHLGTYTTEQLLQELDDRNEVGQRHHHAIHNEQVAELLRKLRLSFSQRPGGLDHKREDA